MPHPSFLTLGRNVLPDINLGYVGVLIQQLRQDRIMTTSV